MAFLGGAKGGGFRRLQGIELQCAFEPLYEIEFL